MFVRSYMLDGETQLVARAIEGEASAFGLLYDHYQPKIYRFVFIKVGRREDAEDLTHQVFLNALRRIREYEVRGLPFSSWLYRIARNHIADYYRTRKRHAPLEEVDPAVLPLAPSSYEEVTQRLEHERVRLALRALTHEHYQEIIIMRFVEELSIKEVAATLGKSEGAVKVLQHRALKALRRALIT